MLDELIKRTHPGAKLEREIITTSLGLAATVKEKAGAYRADRRLSQTGVSAKILEMALGDPWAHLQQQRGKAQAMSAEIAKRRSEMGPPQSDPANVADAILKSEMRAMLRASSRADRLRLARDDDAFAVAALTAPAALSGFGAEPMVEGQPSDLDIVRTAYQQRNFTELFAGLELREEALGAVDAAIEIATKQILGEAGISESEVSRILSTKDDEADLDPDNLPVITRAQLTDWQANDPGRATAEMKRVYNGKAKLVEAA